MSCRYLKNFNKRWSNEGILKVEGKDFDIVFFDAKWLHTQDKREWVASLALAASKATKPIRVCGCFDSEAEAKHPLFIGKFGKAADVNKRDWLWRKHGVYTSTSSSDFKALVKEATK